MKFTLAYSAAALMVGVWASETPKSNETAATSTTSGGATTDKPAVANAVPKPKKKKGCLAGCFAACAGDDKHKGVGDLASGVTNLTLDAIDGQQDGTIDRNEAHNIAGEAAGIVEVLADMAEVFNEVRNQDVPDSAIPQITEPVLEKKRSSKRSTKKATEEKTATTEGSAKKTRSSKKSRTSAPVSEEKKSEEKK